MTRGSDDATTETAVGFARDLADHGDRPALVTGSGTLTYAELAERVVVTGLRLGPTRRLVLVAARNDVDTVVVHLAALAAGHVVLLTDEEHADEMAVTWAPDVVARSGTLVEHHPGSGHDLHPDLALLMSTSGSTGSPRLVRLGAAGVQANAEAIAASLAIRPDDVAATTLPLHYCYGLSVLHSHLARGAAVALTPLSVVDPCFWDHARHHGVTSIAGVPYTFELLERVGLPDLPSLRYVTQAGGRMAPDRVRHWVERGQRHGFDVVVMYGQTEATARMAYLPADLALEHPGAVGTSIPGGDLRVDAPAGEVGEIIYRGPNVMLGYAATPADLRRGREVAELRTGDLGLVGPSGLVEVVGRTTRFAKVLGLRIDLDRVERALADDGWESVCSHDDARLLVAVTAPPGENRVGHRVAAVIGALTGLPQHAVQVVPVPQLPRLTSGKPDARAVPGLAARAEADGAAAPPPPQDVAGLLALLLGRDTVSPADSFVSLGGDSLAYVEVSLRLEGLLGTLPADWHRLSVATLESLHDPVPAGPTPARPSTGRTVESGVLLRAVAIVAVVATHANLLTLTGGAHLLLGLAGFNLARFHLGEADRLERVRRVVRGAARVAVPSMLWIGGVALLTGASAWPGAFLLNGVVGPRAWAEPEWHYWFVEALVALLLGVAVLVSVPWVDRLDRRAPFWFPAGLVAAGLLTRYDVVSLGGGDEIHRAHVVAWLVALGWATARACGPRHRLVLTALVALSVPGFFADPAREAALAVGLLLLVWVRTVRVPAAAVRAMGVLAASSLWIYLTHWQVYPHLEDRYPLLAVAASLAVGIAAWWVAQRLTRDVSRRLDQLRAHGGGSRSAVSPMSSTGRAPGTTLTATGVPTS